MDNDLTLSQMIINFLDNSEKGYSDQLAKIAGYSNGTNFRKVLRKEEKEIEKLDGFIEVVKIIFPDCYPDLLSDFAKTLNPNRITARLLLEYTTVYHMYDLQNEVLELLKKSTRKDVIEWVHVYEIDKFIFEKKIGYLEGINLLSSKKYSKPETKAYSKLAQIYAYYDIRHISMLAILINEIESDIADINNEFLKKSYMGRLIRAKVDVYFHNNKISELLETGLNIEEFLPPTKSATYLTIGNSFIFKSYNKAMHYYDEALKYATGKIENEILKSINFVSILWGKYETCVGTQTESNELFYYAKKNNIAAKKLLEKMDISNYTDFQKGFNYFYQGLIFKEDQYYYMSIEHFNKCGEKFYKQLPLIELKKTGVNEMALRALAS